MHGYLAQAPLLLAILACLALCALSLRAAGRLAGRPLALPFLLVTPLAFAVQEIAERVVAGVSLHSLLEPAVLVGLAAQLPLALAAWLLARLLLRAADAVAGVLRGRPLPEHRSSLRSFGATSVVRLRPRALAFGYAGRAPPAL
jgi:hypothetical protein